MKDPRLIEAIRLMIYFSEVFPKQYYEEFRDVIFQKQFMKSDDVFGCGEAMDSYDHFLLQSQQQVST